MKTKIINIQKEKYVCEECGQEFDYESSCRKHEASHGLGYMTIENRYDSHDGSEYTIIMYKGEEYRDIDDFICDCDIDLNNSAFKLIQL